jgi:two-component system nitrate/nitrite response regulator NarL
MNGDGPPLILIVEDQGLIRAGMHELIRICEPRGQIHEASNYDEAIAKLTSQRYDVVFLDFDLKSDKSGIDILKFIRAMNVDTRAIMLSGHSERELVLECIDAGASGYILKDMESDGLFRRALDTVFQGSIFLPASVLERGGFTAGSVATSRPVSLASMGLRGRTVEVLYYLCQGMPNKAIANKMGVEEATVRKDYVSRLLEAFGVARRTELIVEIARRRIMVPRPEINPRGRADC